MTCKGDCDYDAQFLQELFRLIRDNTDEENNETFCRNFIKQCVTDKVKEISQNPCETCPWTLENSPKECRTKNTCPYFNGE